MTVSVVVVTGFAGPASVVLRMDLVVARLSFENFVVALVKCEPAIERSAAAAAAAVAVAVAAVEIVLAAGRVVPCTAASILNSRSPYLLRPSLRILAAPYMAVHHQTVILVAWSAQSCVAPNVTLPA